VRHGVDHGNARVLPTGTAIPKQMKPASFFTAKPSSWGL